MNIPCWWPCFCKLVPPETIEIEVRHCSFLMEALRTNVMKWWRIDVSKAMWAHCSAMLCLAEHSRKRVQGLIAAALNLRSPSEGCFLQACGLKNFFQYGFWTMRNKKDPLKSIHHFLSDVQTSHVYMRDDWALPQQVATRQLAVPESDDAKLVRFGASREGQTERCLKRQYLARQRDQQRRFARQEKQRGPWLWQ
eukprot:g14129.t1